MKPRIQWLLLASLALIGAQTERTGTVTAQDRTPAPSTPPAQPQKAPSAEAAPKAEYMFVQNSDGVAFEEGKLILKDVSPTTIYFTDRPMRSAGHATTKDFLGLWSKGKDSFAKDPPNASLSVFEGDGKVTDMIVTLSNPQLRGNDLTYDIRTIQGEKPKHSGAAALFIDWIAVGVRRPLVVVPPPHVVVVR
jgi:hypothetical protein